LAITIKKIHHCLRDHFFQFVGSKNLQVINTFWCPELIEIDTLHDRKNNRNICQHSLEKMKRVLLLVSTFMPSSSICVAFSFLPNDNSISKGSKSYNNMELTLSPGSTRCDLVHQNVESTQQQAISPRWLSTMTILSTTLLLQPLSPIRVCAIPNDGLPSAISSTKVTKLSQTKEFQMLPRETSELPPSLLSSPLKEVVKELKDFQDFQDARLDMCADRGIFWEQCFMFGESNDRELENDGVRKRMDTQLIFPMGALNPP